MVSRKSILVGIIILVILIAIFFIFFRGDKDSWIKDSKGIWINHGNPISVPLAVKEQQDAIFCAGEIYATQSLKNASFVSQCLGQCSNYSVDIVNVPRTSLDDLKENQCSDFSEGKLKHIIELNKQGNIVRIV